MRSNCLYPSVTQVLKANGFYNDMDLMPAANSIVGKNRGSALHKACHYLALGKEPPWTNDGGHPELDRFLNGVRKCLREHHIRLIEHEAEWINDSERLIAHPDWHVLIDNLGEAVIEIKTGAMPISVGLQSAGQVVARGKGISDIRRFALHLPGNNEYALPPLTDYRDFPAFRLFLMTVWKRSEYQGKFWLTDEEGDDVELP